MGEESALITEVQAARILSLAPRTLAGWRRRKYGPRYVALARNAIRYYPSDLFAFIEARPVQGIGPTPSGTLRFLRGKNTFYACNEGNNMKRTNIWAFASALVVAVLIGMSQLVNAAEASVVLGRSLATLAGNWAGEGSATFAICYNADFSGYERNTIVHDGRLDPGVELISKPFSVMQLATKLREMFGGD